jgi:hypothetical protein
VILFTIMLAVLRPYTFLMQHLNFDVLSQRRCCIEYPVDEVDFFGVQSQAIELRLSTARSEPYKLHACKYSCSETLRCRLTPLQSGGSQLYLAVGKHKIVCCSPLSEMQ